MRGRSKTAWIGPIAVAACVLAPPAAQAAPALDGAQMNWPWALPFLAMLLSIAAGPLLFAEGLAPSLRQDRVRLGAADAAAVGGRFRPAGGPGGLACTPLLAEYLSFIVLLFALYVVAGGILVTGNLRGTPRANPAHPRLRHRCSPASSAPPARR